MRQAFYCFRHGQVQEQHFDKDKSKSTAPRANQRQRKSHETEADYGLFGLDSFKRPDSPGKVRKGSLMMHIAVIGCKVHAPAT